MRNIITNLFYLSITILIILGLLVVVSWLFDSEPENLHKVFSVWIDFSLIMFGINLLFGGKRK